MSIIKKDGIRVGIDARSLTTGSKTGIQRYIVELVMKTASQRDDITFFLFYPSLFNGGKYLASFGRSLPPNIKHINMPIWKCLSNKRFHLFWYDLILPFFIWVLKIDVFHGSAEIIPSIPTSSNCKAVLTIHHLWANELNSWDEDRIQRMKSSAVSAHKILTVSKSSKKNIANLWDIAEEKIQAITIGYREKTSEAVCTNIKKQDMILFVGSSYPRKNVMGILEAYSVLKEEKQITEKLYLVGKEITHEPRKYVEANNLSNDVKFFINLGDEKLDVFYQRAKAFVFPSFEEGFGMPVLEALSHHTPVVTSDIPVFREIVKDCGFYVNPHSPQDIARGIWQALTDTKKVEEMLNKAPSLLKQYSWQATSRNILKLYDELCPKNNIMFFEPSSGFGGSGNALFNLLKQVDKKSIVPIVVTLNDGPQFEKIKALGNEVIKLGSKKQTLKSGNGASSYTQFLLDFFFVTLPMIFKLLCLIRKYKIKAVHINTNIISGIPAIVAAKISKAPCICHIRQTRKLIKREMLIIRWIDRFIVLNKDVFNTMLKHVPEKKLSIIYDGVDLSSLAGPIPDAGKTLRDVTNKTVGMIGRMVEGKGHEDFVRAAKEVLKTNPNVNFLIVGDMPNDSDSYGKGILNLIQKEKLSGKIRFSGWLNDLKPIISDMDIVVQPYTLPEGLPNVLIEAMAKGKPTVSTNIPGPTEIIIHKKTGLLVPPGSPLALAKAIKSLLDNTDMAKKMGEAGRERVKESFDMKKNVIKIHDLYEYALKK